MTWDVVLLLPMVAVAVAAFFPLRVDGPRSRQSLKKSKFRIVILRRLIVFVLPISAAIALMTPIKGLSNLLVALLISGSVLLPAFFFHLYMSNEKQKRMERRKAHSAGAQQGEHLEVSTLPSSRIVRKVARSTKGDRLAAIVAALDPEKMTE